MRLKRKRVFLLLVVMALTMLLTACGTTTGGSSQQADTLSQAEKSRTEPDSQNEILVVYFSCTGNTQKVAEAIAGVTGADIYQIKAAQEYTTEDIDYNNSNSRATIEQNDPSVRPVIDGTIKNWDQYKTVFLGHPIWWGQEPRIMDTFAESYDFTGKTVIPFCTSGSSGVGQSASNMAKLSVTGTWLEGKRFAVDTSANEIGEWIDGLGLEQS